MPPLSALEAALEQEFRRYHVRAQITRFGSGFIVAFIWGLWHGYTDWTTVLPIAASAAWTAAMETWPTLPLALVRKRLRAARDAAASGPMPPGKSGAP